MLVDASLMGSKFTTFRFTPVTAVAGAALVFSVFGCARTSEPERRAKNDDLREKSANAQATVTVAGLPPSYEPTIEASKVTKRESPPNMVWIPGGEFSMGSSDPTTGGHCHEPMDDARPIHRVRVDGFFMDRSEVTNAAFEEFTRKTGYVTLAERKPSSAELPGVPAENLVAGSSVFSATSERVSLENPLAWWRYVRGANWRHPEGPNSTLEGRSNYPVVHIAYEDALAYAKWAKKDLPTEAEWEFAARGGRSGELYPWGNELKPNGEFIANIYQGEFPVRDTGEDGFRGAAPVGSFPANGYDLVDMAGNVWEWTKDWYRADAYKTDAASGVVENPGGPSVSFDPTEPGTKKRVQRGGSFLCTTDYCSRYMVGTRGKAEPSSPSNHVGFRLVLRASGS